MEVLALWCNSLLSTEPTGRSEVVGKWWGLPCELHAGASTAFFSQPEPPVEVSRQPLFQALVRGKHLTLHLRYVNRVL